MQSVYEAAGGHEGLLRLAEAWHARVMADEVVSHAFSHGFHPQHHERLAAYWGEALWLEDAPPTQLVGSTCTVPSFHRPRSRTFSDCSPLRHGVSPR